MTSCPPPAPGVPQPCHSIDSCPVGQDAAGALASPRLGRGLQGARPTAPHPCPAPPAAAAGPAPCAHLGTQRRCRQPPCPPWLEQPGPATREALDAAPGRSPGASSGSEAAGSPSSALTRGRRSPGSSPARPAPRPAKPGTRAERGGRRAPSPARAPPAPSAARSSSTRRSGDPGSAPGLCGSRG